MQIIIILTHGLHSVHSGFFFSCFLSANDYILQYQLGLYIFMQKI